MVHDSTNIETYVSKRWEMGRVSFKLDSFQGIHPALKDLADLNCGSNSCAARANGRPRTTHRFHYYFRNNLHLFVRMQISLSLSLFLSKEKERRAHGLCLCPRSSAIDDQPSFAICSPSRDPWHLACRCSRFSLQGVAKSNECRPSLSRMIDLVRIIIDIFVLRIIGIIRIRILVKKKEREREREKNRWNYSIRNIVA